jgi:eukaryotic-like serine/threonine-protein kinase
LILGLCFGCLKPKQSASSVCNLQIRGSLMPGEISAELSIFSEAIDIPLEQRAEFLAHACAGDDALRRKIERLLVTHGQVGDFLEDSPSQLLPRTLLPSMQGVNLGEQIGNYKLLQQIGEGGCGVVYLAEQKEPVRREVALKIIKPGMDTKAVIARFEAERQALALMEHPNIAKVFDAGATASGRPYFVMELVRGVKITDYCDRNSVDTRGRLQLFIQVCHAVQHAHQKGIIHRDIKPSNILVTVLPDGSPSPVIIDFGIAKAVTNQRLTEKTLFTALEMLIGTPAYMSPEQTAFPGGDVDTRTDIYSLGVLLYELLTGTTPFESGELLKAGIDGVRHVIQTREAIRPSTRLKIMVAAELNNVSRHRQTAPLNLIRSVRGDLDWIVMKALEKERTRRYATANEYVLDIRRYLNGEAISARPPSFPYKLQKLVSRNKLLFAALSTVGVSCLAGLIVTTWSLSRERRALEQADLSRRTAETNAEVAKAEATRSSEVIKLLDGMLQGVGPSVAKGRDTTILREMLDQAAGHMENESKHEPAVQAEMLSKIGNIYRKIGSNENAKRMALEALAIYQKNGTTNDENTARVLFDLGAVRLISETEIQEALSNFTES